MKVRESLVSPPAEPLQAQVDRGETGDDEKQAEGC